MWMDRNLTMKKTALLIATATLGLQACVMAPPQPVPVVVQQPPGVVMTPGVVVPPGVVYVAPTYAAPSVGFVWEFHPHYGWGWRHPQRGWHRGWR
jgi:hypothetical protein